MLLHQCILVSSIKNVNMYNKRVTSTDLIKLKQSRYRPGVAQRIPGSKVSRFRDNGTGWW